MPEINMQVVAPIPTKFSHCQHCELFFQEAGIGGQVHRAGLEQYPEEVIQDAAKLADWLSEVNQRFCGHLRIRVIDPQSIQGFFLSLRHWVRSYPTFIVEGRKAYAGWSRDSLDHILQEYLPGSFGSSTSAS
jgi:hypothetical protein